MKFYFCSLLLLLACASTVVAESATPAATPDPKMMEAFTKASTPGEEHKLLQKYVGKWDHTVSWWMKADAKPETSKGSSEIESILGGRFIKHSVTGTSMGQPFEGLSITGYDNIQKKFSSLWIDNMSTGTMAGKGQYDKAKDAIVDEGSFSCPMSPTGAMSYRAVMTLPKANSFKYELFVNGEDGKEFKMMEVVYTKAS